MPGLELAQEPWQSAWPDAAALTDAHSIEVDGGVEPRRRFKIDVTMMAQLSNLGVLRIFTARRGGKMVGYLTWQTTPDVESEGLLIAQQGAWFVAPGHPGVAFKLFIFSLDKLRESGVQCVFPHHRTQGRGDRLGRFFSWLGAKHIQQTYCLWIGESNA